MPWVPGRCRTRVVSAIGMIGSSDRDGRITFEFDGQTVQFAARWLEGTTVGPQDGTVDSEVVIEHVDGDVAIVEPWALVEGRL